MSQGSGELCEWLDVVSFELTFGDHAFSKNHQYVIDLCFECSVSAEAHFLLQEQT